MIFIVDACLVSKHAFFLEAQFLMETKRGFVEIENLAADFVDPKIMKSIGDCRLSHQRPSPFRSAGSGIKSPVCTVVGWINFYIHKAARLLTLIKDHQVSC